MDIQYKIILGAIAALLLLAQATLIGFKILEKREARRMFSESNNPGRPKMNGSVIPGFAQICIEHAKKLVKIETCLKHIVKTRDEDHDELQDWKKEMRQNFIRIFNRIEK